MMPNGKDNLIEEYKICQEKIKTLEYSVWTTATIFGIGSVAVIFTLSKGDINPVNLKFVVSSLVIGILIIWRRITKRWWSMEQLTLFRMRQIEEKIGFQINRLIDCYDKRLRGIELPEFCQNINFEELPRNYEYRGVQPMMELFFYINISVWIAFILFHAFPEYDLTFKITIHSIITIIVVLVFIYLFFKFYKKNE